MIRAILAAVVVAAAGCCSCDRALARVGGAGRLAEPASAVALVQEAVRMGEYRAAWCCLTPETRREVSFTRFRYVALNVRPPGWDRTVREFVATARITQAGPALVRVSDDRYMFDVVLQHEGDRWLIDWKATQEANSEGVP